MLVIGHRGAPSLEHENTIPSFKAALKNNVDGLEFDVQYTKDQELVIYHDFHIILNNKNFNIADLTLDELRNSNLSYTIPTFKELLVICPKDKIINVEIKSKHIYNTNLIRDIIQLLFKNDLQDNIIISSFNPFVLLELKRQTKKFKIGLLWSKDITEKWYVTHYSYKFLKPYSFHADIKYINTEISDWAHSKGMKLFLYTVNTHEQLQLAKEARADAIFSDYPNMLE